MYLRNIEHNVNCNGGGGALSPPYNLFNLTMGTSLTNNERALRGDLAFTDETRVKLEQVLK